MKKWWKEQIDKPLLKAFLHYYQASDSELTSVAAASDVYKRQPLFSDSSF